METSWGPIRPSTRSQILFFCIARFILTPYFQPLSLSLQVILSPFSKEKMRKGILWSILSFSVTFPSSHTFPLLQSEFFHCLQCFRKTFSRAGFPWVEGNNHSATEQLLIPLVWLWCFFCCFAWLLFPPPLCVWCSALSQKQYHRGGTTVAERLCCTLCVSAGAIHVQPWASPSSWRPPRTPWPAPPHIHSVQRDTQTPWEAVESLVSEF